MVTYKSKYLRAKRRSASLISFVRSLTHTQSRDALMVKGRLSLGLSFDFGTARRAPPFGLL